MKIIFLSSRLTRFTLAPPPRGPLPRYFSRKRRSKRGICRNEVGKRERERELRGDEGDKGCEAMEEKGKKEEDVRKGCFAGPANGISL